MPKKLTNFEVGDLVFAKVKGFPAWPARVREKKGKKFDVIFFGTNETAVVKPEECSDYLENRKSFTQKYIKKRNYVSALQEIEDAYNELSNAVVTKSEEAVEIMPVEESILEDTDKTFVSEANANKVSLDDSKNESMETDQETTNTTEIKTEKILCSPTPMNQETSPQTPVTPIQAKSEIVSSRGRKIKPKRFMDDDFNEEAATPPAAKRLKIRSTETMDPEPSTAAEAGSAAEGEVVLVDEEGLAVNYLNSVLILNRENTESLAVYTVRDMKLRLAKLEEILSPAKKDNLKNPELSLPSRHENSVLLVSHHNCVFGLYMDIDRPEDFDSKEEEVQYEVRTGNEIMALYCEIESDERKISDIPEKAICRFSKFEQHLCLTREMLDLTDTQSEKKISSLRIEAYIMKLIYDVREHVSLDHSRLNLPKSVAILRQLNKYELNRIMLMKHPLFVRTVMKLANYKGLTSATRPWTATDDRRAEQIRVEAVKLKNKIIGLVNLRSLVWPEFLRVVHNFRNGVHSSTTAEFLEITSEEEYEHMVLLENRKQRKRIADLNAASRVPEQKKSSISVQSDSTSEAATPVVIGMPTQKTNAVDDKNKKKDIVLKKKKSKQLTIQLTRKPKKPKYVDFKEIEIDSSKLKNQNTLYNVQVTVSKKDGPLKRSSKDDISNKEKNSEPKSSQNNETNKVTKNVIVEMPNVSEDGVSKNDFVKDTLKLSDTEELKVLSKAQELDKNTEIKITCEQKLIKKSAMEQKTLSEKIEIRTVKPALEIKAIKPPLEIKAIKPPHEIKSIKSPTEMKSNKSPLEIMIKSPLEMKSITPSVSITPIGPTVYQKPSAFSLKSQNMQKAVLIPKAFIPKPQSKLVVLKDGSTPKIQISKGQVAAGKAQFSKLPSSVKLQLIKDGSQKIQTAKADNKPEATSPTTSPSKST